MHIDVLSLYPSYIEGPLQESILRRAIQSNLLTVTSVDIRRYSTRPDKRVDDRPYGGGPGMVMMAEPLLAAIRSSTTEESHVIHLSPQGRVLTSAVARELSTKQHIVMVCGHYEGIDQRVLDQEIDDEISIGDYVLTNGCLAALVVMDALARFIPGVLGHEEAALQDSFEQTIFDCPHYTTPPSLEGESVPEILLTGHHKAIQKWRSARSYEKTKIIRPDLFAKACFGLQGTGLTQLSHCVVYSYEYEKTIAWYEKIFGIEAQYDQKRPLQAFFSLHEQEFTLLSVDSVTGTTAGAFSFKVSKDQFEKVVKWGRKKEACRIEDNAIVLIDPDERCVRIVADM